MNPILTLTAMKEQGITIEKYEYVPGARHHISEPVVIDITLRNKRDETFFARTYCSPDIKHVLTSDDYLRLVLNRYYETEESLFHRSWQYKMWGTPIYRLKPTLARKSEQCTNEFDYYHFYPSWYQNCVVSPRESFRKRFQQFLA